jgi:putative effector of murein hydrolase
MDTALSHLFHSLVITVILYIIMKFFLKQTETMSLNRSILIGAIALIYMILFGHGLPTNINRNI